MTPQRCPWLLLLAICGLLALAAPAQASFFDAFPPEASIAPPYPTTPPVRTHVLDDVGSGVVPLQTMFQGLKDLSSRFGTPYYSECYGSDDGSLPGGMGSSASFWFLLAAVPPIPHPPDPESYYDLFTGVSIDATGQLGGLCVFCEACPEEDVTRYISVQNPGSNSFFDVEFLVLAPETGDKAIHYRQRYQLSDEAVAAGGHFSSRPVAHLLSGLDSFFDVFVEISIQSPLPHSDVLHVTTTAALEYPPVPADRTTWGALKAKYK